MASLSAKFLLVTVIVQLSLIPLAVHAEAGQYDAEAELEARFLKDFLKKHLMDCNKIASFAEGACTKLKDKVKK
ncbi:hypothetical protein NFI96_032638 [Prochilodus magdalenae]|nr:hypothetical protein NFI96_032638 [Prochilodus magdalenae]